MLYLSPDDQEVGWGSERISTVQFAAQTVQLQPRLFLPGLPCNVRQMLDEVMEWDRPRLSRRGQSLITPRGTLVGPAGSRALDIITSYSNKQQAVGCR